MPPLRDSCISDNRMSRIRDLGQFVAWLTRLVHDLLTLLNMP